MQEATFRLAWGTVCHLVADWLLQSTWMADNKKCLKHPAAWVHSGIYALAMLLVFPWYLALFLGLAHLLIDTGKPMKWWFSNFKRMGDGPMTVPVILLTDQSLHIVLIALAALVTAI